MRCPGCGREVCEPASYDIKAIDELVQEERDRLGLDKMVEYRIALCFYCGWFALFGYEDTARPLYNRMRAILGTQKEF